PAVCRPGALGDPRGRARGGVFSRLWEAARAFEKVLKKRESRMPHYVRCPPADPNTVYAGLWRQQQSFREGDDFGAPGNGIFKSTDGGTTWTHLTDGLPDQIEANLAIAPSDPGIVYAMVAGVAPAAGQARAT